MAEEKKQCQKLMDQKAKLCDGMAELGQKVPVLKGNPTKNDHKEETTIQENSDISNKKKEKQWKTKANKRTSKRG